jgi:hypothetical protein
MNSMFQALENTEYRWSNLFFDDGGLDSLARHSCAK